jgi:hypothetical protein
MISEESRMDTFWTDRAAVEKRLPADAVDFDALDYDYDRTQYCLGGEPFTGFTAQRFPDGGLESVVTYRDGVADGVSVGWYPSGQIEQYSDLRAESLHGTHREWDEDGELVTDEVYADGVRVSGDEEDRDE